MCLERLRLELVQECEELALRGFDDSAAVLPDRVLYRERAVDRVALILVDVVHAKPLGEGPSEYVESHAFLKDGFEVGQGLEPVPLSRAGSSG